MKECWETNFRKMIDYHGRLVLRLTRLKLNVIVTVIAVLTISKSFSRFSWWSVRQWCDDYLSLSLSLFVLLLCHCSWRFYFVLCQCTYYYRKRRKDFSKNNQQSHTYTVNEFCRTVLLVVFFVFVWGVRAGPQYRSHLGIDSFPFLAIISSTTIYY